jgi:ATP-dependent DNA helicase RecG
MPISNKDVLKLIEVWEGQTTEFKREFTTDPIRESLVSFSNDYMEQGGGIIIVGVEPKTKQIVGIESNSDDLMLRITGLCRDGNIVPTIAPEMYPVQIDTKEVLVIEVKKSGRRPHRSNNICYIRIGSSNKKATPDEEFELVRRSGRIPFDLAPIRESSLEDLDFGKFEQEYLPKRISSDVLALNGRSSIDWLENLKFVYREAGKYVPTVSAILLFGKQPQNFITHSSVDFLRFEGEDPSFPILDRKEITGNLDQIIKTGVELVEQYMVKGYRFSEKSPVRTDIYEYPLRAIREAIANAVVHRDYEDSRAQVSIKNWIHLGLFISSN